MEYLEQCIQVQRDLHPSPRRSGRPLPDPTGFGGNRPGSATRVLSRGVLGHHLFTTREPAER